ncbi:MAG TPA: chemotaxis protein CheW [Polyangia bacterium]|jgi:purine-binding chemotaxis protein CheW|nr:chemotaxis protein CheW [Polyangia bacterium]
MKGGLGDPRARAAPRVELAQLVAFGVGPGEYALDIMRIKEIINPVAVTPIPKAPHFIEGVIELRGAILPVVDVRKRFDLEASPAVRAMKYLIVGIDVGETRMIVGLVVDRVSEPLRVPKSEIKGAPQLTTEERAYFNGVVHHQGRMLMVLDVDALLSSSEKQILSGMARG